MAPVGSIFKNWISNEERGGLLDQEGESKNGAIWSHRTQNRTQKVTPDFGPSHTARRFLSHHKTLLQDPNPNPIIMSSTTATTAERLAAAQAAIAKAAADKEAALAAAQAIKAAKEAAKAAKAEARAAAAAAKAALPKRPVGRPRKNPLPTAPPPADPESEDTDSGSIVTATERTDADRIATLEAELAETRARLAATEAAYHREHAILMSIRATLSTAPL